MSPRLLPQNPNARLISGEARTLLQDFRQGRVLSVTHYSLFYTLHDTPNPRLADTQHMVALEYGYASWLKLQQHVEALARDSDSLEALDGL